jgi:neopullulanase
MDRRSRMKSRYFDWRAYFLLPLLLLICASLPVSARSHRKRRKPIKQGKPVLESVAPPNWWSGLPDPMLLLHGKNLIGARVTSTMAGISVRRTRISTNGHWAFIWLDIGGAPPQQFNLSITTLSGRLNVPFEIRKPHDPADGFAGFSSADVLYWVAPDLFPAANPSADSSAAKSRSAVDSAVGANNGGELREIENHLDYIQQLGATTVGIGPLYAQGDNPGSVDRKQDTIDMYRLNPSQGTIDDLSGLAQALHKRGIKLVLDVVPNHVGSDNPWVADPPSPDWFHGTVAHHVEASDELASLTDPHAPPADYQAVVDGWMSDTLPDLNQSNPLVREYLIQNVVWWVESGTLDGLRLGAFPYVERIFWQDLHRVLRALYPRLTTAGEIPSADPNVVAFFAGGARHAGIDTGLYAPFDFPSYFALRSTLAGAPPDGDTPITKLTEVQRQDWLYPHSDRLLTFFDGANEDRFLSLAGATPARLKLAFGLLATMRGMPSIYFGDEIAMTETAGARQTVSEFFASSGNFTDEGRTPEQESMHSWVQGLFALRAHHVVLQTGVQQDILADPTGLVFARIEAPAAGRAVPLVARGEIMLVLMNKSDQPRTFHLDFSHTALQGIRALLPAWNTKQQESVAHNECDVTLGAEQLEIFEAVREEPSPSVDDKTALSAVPPSH